MDWFHINRKINNILNVLEDNKRELLLKHEFKKDILESEYLQSVRNCIIENIEKCNELKTFKCLVDILMSHLTRVILQVNRLSEENQWLKEELCDLNKKNNLIDEKLVIESADLLKTEYVYQMRLMQYPNDNILLSNTNDFDLIEIENIFCENASSEQKTPISETMSGLSFIIREYVNEGRLDIAVAMCNKSIYDMKQIDEKQPDIATLLCMLGFLYKDMLKWEDAACCINEALKIREKYYGPDTSIVASTINNLAIVLAANGKYQEAESLSRKALIIRENLYGSNHEYVAKQMNNLGLLLINMNSFEEGEQFFNKAMDIYSKLKNSDIFYLKTSTNLANLYVKREEYNKAEQQLYNNLEAIHKYRFNDVIKNVLKIYINKTTRKIDGSSTNCLLFDQYLVPEIVNIKFLIRLYEKKNNLIVSLKLKKCLQALLPHINECDDIFQHSEYIYPQLNPPLTNSEIQGKSKVSNFFGKLTKLMNIQ